MWGGRSSLKRLSAVFEEVQDRALALRSEREMLATSRVSEYRTGRDGRAQSSAT